ncbi:LLM class flavin-dependent oxidoreductase [Streptomyces hoynatensis]|uniref:LLM class flavin-dependent oxidoreductase n=1 Tax=Streptomyces hoynatensis TaxID=1141874 RepID=A0A3A9ZES6_9ACTN|nr:LLM class flavin-dependent oxidoreductase [Streptomyces hoynatensis]RKN45766.1 LLM class flavin-dependent oxidoreductase [Streptomyces hoynatensis]
MLTLSFALDDPAGNAHSAARWTDLVRRAERGALDFVTLGDSFAPPPPGSAGRLDAVAVLARVAPATRHLGLVPTVTTTHTEPFHTASALATLDFVSEGRAGWLVDVSRGEAEAAAFGRKPAAPEAELWAEAADAAEVAARLWDSWEDDAEIRDVATGRFVDRDKLHYIDFEGRWFRVRGPSIVPRPPQGRPPVAVALGAEDPAARHELAARHADLVLLAADAGDARRATVALRERVAAAGRDPEAVRVLLRLAVDLGGAERPPGPPAPAAGFRGSPAGLAALLAARQAESGADGFHLTSAAPAADLAALVEGTLPPLRARGLFRTEYRGRTLRDHLGLPRPASRYAKEAP